MELAEHDFREYIVDVMVDRIEEPQGNRGSDGLLSHLANAFWPDKMKPELKREESNTRAILSALQSLANRDLSAIPASAASVEGELVSEGDGESVGE